MFRTRNLHFRRNQKCPTCGIKTALALSQTQLHAAGCGQSAAELRRMCGRSAAKLRPKCGILRPERPSLTPAERMKGGFLLKNRDSKDKNPFNAAPPGGLYAALCRPEAAILVQKRRSGRKTEIRNQKTEGNPKPEIRKGAVSVIRHSGFGFDSEFGIRISPLFFDK